MKKEKIAIICPADYPVPAVEGGAIETLIDIFLRENEKFKECNIIVYSYFNKEALDESKKYSKVKFEFIKVNKSISKVEDLFIKVFRRLFKIEIPTLFIRKVIKDINKKQITKVIIEGNKQYVIPIERKIKDCEIYLHIHHEAFSDSRPTNMKVIEKCKKIITVSDYIKRRTCENKNINPNNIIVLKNCTNIELFNKNNYLEEREIIRNKYKIDKNEVVLLFSGRILEIKGVRELILAFRKYCINLNAKMLIVGNSGFGKSITSEYDKEVLKLTKEIKDKIIFTGFIHNSELPKIHSISDIAVIPSIWEEPAGLVVIEAMSSGLPVIVTDSGGIPEYVNDKCSIIIKRDKNMIDNMGEAMVKLIENNETRNIMGRNSRKQALQFSTENYYNNFIDILE